MLHNAPIRIKNVALSLARAQGNATYISVTSNQYIVEGECRLGGELVGLTPKEELAIVKEVIEMNQVERVTQL